MQTRDTQSDLLLIDRIERPDTPFAMRYFTEEQPEAGHLATFDGTAYTGCTPLSGGLLMVRISAGTLTEGRIHVRRHYAIADQGFTDDQQHDLRYTEKSDIRLRADASSSAERAYVFEADAWRKHHPTTERTAEALDATTHDALQRLKERIANLNL